jgi:hypothetical protein
MEPMVLNKLPRYTLSPKIGNTDAIREKYYVTIRSILNGTKVNWIDFLVAELMCCKHEVRGSLGYQPYIMALVKHLVVLEGIEGVRHKSYGPHFNDSDSPTKDMPQPQAPLAEVGEPSARDGACDCRRNADAAILGWVPLASYFEPFFEGIRS